MTVDDLTTAQAKTLLKTVLPMLDFLHRLIERMDKKRFVNTDPLYRDVCRAYDAVHALRMRLHYESVGHGVGKAPKPDPVTPQTGGSEKS